MLPHRQNVITLQAKSGPWANSSSCSCPLYLADPCMWFVCAPQPWSTNTTLPNSSNKQDVETYFTPRDIVTDVRQPAGGGACVGWTDLGSLYLVRKKLNLNLYLSLPFPEHKPTFLFCLFVLKKFYIFFFYKWNFKSALCFSLFDNYFWPVLYTVYANTNRKKEPLG